MPGFEGEAVGARSGGHLPQLMEVLLEMKEDAMHSCMDAFATAVWAVQQEVRANEGLALVEGVRREMRREIEVVISGS